MYFFSIDLNLSFDDAKAKVLETLQAEKFGVVSEVNVQAVMQNKLGITIPPYLILGACSPGFAKRVLDVSPQAGTLLPCNVVLRHAGDNKTSVDFMNPQTVLALANNSTINAVGTEVLAALERVRDRLSN